MADDVKANKDKKPEEVVDETEKTAEAVKDLADVEASEQKNAPEKPVKKDKKRRRRWPKVVLALILIFFVLPVLYLGWLGFVPGLSNLLGAHNPKDLGVTYTQADADSFFDKTNSVELDYVDAPAHPTKPGKKSIFTDPVPQLQSLTQEEITARVNLSGWSNNPFSDVQFRFSDGRVEASGVLIVDRIPDFIELIGGVEVSQEDIDEALPWLRRFASKPAIYIDANAEVVNNQLEMSINSASIGRYSIPTDFADEILTNATASTLDGIPNLDMESVTFGDGVLNFEGTGPSKVYVQR